MVADQLASINEFAHKNTVDGTVGPHCIVAWRHNKSGVHKGGGGHQFYENTKRTDDSCALPTIANGMDVQAIMQVTMPHIMELFSKQLLSGQEGDLDVAKLNSELANLPRHSNEELN